MKVYLATRAVAYEGFSIISIHRTKKGAVAAAYASYCAACSDWDKAPDDLSENMFIEFSPAAGSYEYSVEDWELQP